MQENALEYAHHHRQDIVHALVELLRIPSVSTLPAHAGDMHRAATWLASYLRDSGLDTVQLISTAGHPVVYSEWLGAGDGAPTLLAYGHYDVQPVDPIDEWQTPPFEPEMRGENLYARGASDDKGQLMAVVAAVRAYLHSAGRLTINFKIMLEGEEEISSPNMPAFVRDNQAMLAADAVLICDGSILAPDLPMITYGVRGMAYMEVEVRGPATDLHSGTFGGVVDNPFNVLVQILAQLKDPDTGRVNIPGFYDRVQPLTGEERERLAAVPFGETETLSLTGARALAGEAGYTPVERTAVRPTLDIHGMPGGFTGEGKKTVIPARASAKVSMRLVPDQDPAEIARLFKERVLALAPDTVEVTVRTLGIARPAYIDPGLPALQAAH
ncbi:MAG TPA: dipeptidase, partial [Alphaproteobacteria bacterium]|nr:dipeptidase [Alphaproteobacteria bacterium]